MADKQVKVGPITMAVGLIVFGILMLLGNFFSYEYLTFVWKLWPILLIGLGVEFLIRDAMAKRSSPSPVLKFSWGSVFIIGLIMLVGFTSTITHKIIGTNNIDQIIREGLFGNSVQFTRTFEEEPIEANENDSFILKNRVGNITILPSEDERVYVGGEIKAKGPNNDEAKRRAEKVVIDFTKSGGRVNLSAQVPNDSLFGENIQINYTIFVPEGVKIEVENNVGNISVKDTQAIRVHVGNNVGNIEIKNPTGDLDLNTNTGNIEVVSDILLEATYNLETNVGEITVEIPEDSNIEVKANADIGDIDGPKDFTVDGKGPKKSMQGILGAGEGKLSLNTNIGNITLSIN